MKAEIWLGEYLSPRTSTQASPLPPSMTLYGRFFRSLARSASSARRPIRRLTAKMVFSALVTACRLAGWRTSRSSSVKATIDGVVRAPSAFSITRGWLPSMMATQLLVVPRSIPMTLAMLLVLFLGDIYAGQPAVRHFPGDPSFERREQSPRQGVPAYIRTGYEGCKRRIGWNLRYPPRVKRRLRRENA